MLGTVGLKYTIPRIWSVIHRAPNGRGTQDLEIDLPPIRQTFLIKDVILTSSVAPYLILHTYELYSFFWSAIDSSSFFNKGIDKPLSTGR